MYKRRKNVSLFDLTSEEVYTWHFPLITIPYPEEIFIRRCAISEDVLEASSICLHFKKSHQLEILPFAIKQMTPFWNFRFVHEVESTQRDEFSL